MATFKDSNPQGTQKNGTEKTFLSKEDIEKKQYKPTTTDEEFRPIPISATDSDDYVEAYFHTLKIGDYTQKVYCPKHNDGHECAVCNKKDEILKTQSSDRSDPKNKEIYKEAMKYAARKFYIFRGIDMGNPKEGVKFYRFGESAKKEGVWDKLYPVIKDFNAKYGLYPNDIQKGASFVMSCVEKLFNGNKYYEPSSIKISEPSPLSTSQEKVDNWVNDPTTWRDIFRPSTLPGYNVQQYLIAALNGTLPTWDKANKQWIDYQGNPIVLNNNNGNKPEPSAEVEQNNQSLDAGVQVIVGKANKTQDVASATDDLPF